MRTEWQAQIKDGEYSLQFQTWNYDYYKEVAKVCQKIMKKRDKAVDKERASQMRGTGAL